MLFWWPRMQSRHTWASTTIFWKMIWWFWFNTIIPLDLAGSSFAKIFPVFLGTCIVFFHHWPLCLPSCPIITISTTIYPVVCSIQTLDLWKNGLPYSILCLSFYPAMFCATVNKAAHACWWERNAWRHSSQVSILVLGRGWRGAPCTRGTASSSHWRDVALIAHPRELGDWFVLKDRPYLRAVSLPDYSAVILMRSADTSCLLNKVIWGPPLYAFSVGICAGFGGMRYIYTQRAKTISFLSVYRFWGCPTNWTAKVAEPPLGPLNSFLPYVQHSVVLVDRWPQEESSLLWSILLELIYADIHHHTVIHLLFYYTCWLRGK